MAPTFDAVGPSSAGAGNLASTSLTWSHTITGANTVLLVGVGLGKSVDTGITTTVTYAGVSMTSLGKVHCGGITAGYLEVFGIIAAAQTANVVVTVAGGTPNSLDCGSLSFAGAGQTIGTAFGTPATANTPAPTTTPGITLASNTNGNIIAGFICAGSGISSFSGAGTSRCIINEDPGTTAGGCAAGATAPATGSSVTMTWAATSDDFAGIIVEVLPAAGGTIDNVYPQWDPPGLSNPMAWKGYIPPPYQIAVADDQFQQAAPTVQLTPPGLQSPMAWAPLMTEWQSAPPITGTAIVTNIGRTLRRPALIRRTRVFAPPVEAVTPPVSSRRQHRPLKAARFQVVRDSIKEAPPVQQAKPPQAPRRGYNLSWVRKSKQAGVFTQVVTSGPQALPPTEGRQRPQWPKSLLYRGHRVETIPPQFNPPYPWTENLQRKTWPRILLKRGKSFQPIPPQEAPTPEITQKRLRRPEALLKRGRQTNTVPPQFNPPYPVAEVLQRKTWSRVLLRRGKAFLPTPPQDQPTLELVQKRNTYPRSLLRRGKAALAVPTQALFSGPQALPPTEGRQRPQWPRILQRRSRITFPVQPQLNPPWLNNENVQRRNTWANALLKRGHITFPVQPQITFVNPPLPMALVKQARQWPKALPVRRLKQYTKPRKLWSVQNVGASPVGNYFVIPFNNDTDIGPGDWFYLYDVNLNYIGEFQVTYPFNANQFAGFVNVPFQPNIFTGGGPGISQANWTETQTFLQTGIWEPPVVRKRPVPQVAPLYPRRTKISPAPPPPTPNPPLPTSEIVQRREAYPRALLRRGRLAQVTPTQITLPSARLTGTVQKRARVLLQRTRRVNATVGHVHAADHVRAKQRARQVIPPVFQRGTRNKPTLPVLWDFIRNRPPKKIAVQFPPVRKIQKLAYMPPALTPGEVIRYGHRARIHRLLFVPVRRASTEVIAGNEPPRTKPRTRPIMQFSVRRTFKPTAGIIYGQLPPWIRPRARQVIPPAVRRQPNKAMPVFPLYLDFIRTRAIRRVTIPTPLRKIQKLVIMPPEMTAGEIARFIKKPFRVRGWIRLPSRRVSPIPAPQDIVPTRQRVKLAPPVQRRIIRTATTSVEAQYIYRATPMKRQRPTMLRLRRNAQTFYDRRPNDVVVPVRRSVLRPPNMPSRRTRIYPAVKPPIAPLLAHRVIKTRQYRRFVRRMRAFERGWPQSRDIRDFVLLFTPPALKWHETEPQDKWEKSPALIAKWTEADLSHKWTESPPSNNKWTEQ